MKKITLGAYNLLKVVKKVDFGMYLDQDEKIIATTLEPLAKVGDFACLEVAWVNEYGAFLNWGLMKDLFCPFREQKMRMQKGERYIVYVKLDEESYRIMATAKVDKYLNQDKPAYKHGDEVDLLVQQKTELGFKVIIDNAYGGLIYDNQVFRPLHTGDRLKGYIDRVRPDGKIDVTIQPTGRRQTEEFSDVLLAYLQDNGGHCSLGDKSPAELIADRFKVSKKTFKKAIGDLYRKRLITISDEGIDLV